jgi:hypothetical protein
VRILWVLPCIAAVACSSKAASPPPAKAAVTPAPTGWIEVDDRQLTRRIELGRGFLDLDAEGGFRALRLYNADDMHAQCALRWSSTDASGDGSALLADDVTRFPVDVRAGATMSLELPRLVGTSMRGPLTEYPNELQLAVTIDRVDGDHLEVTLAIKGAVTLRGQAAVTLCREGKLPPPLPGPPKPATALRRDLEAICASGKDPEELRELTLESPQGKALVDKLDGTNPVYPMRSAIFAEAPAGTIERAGMPQCAYYIAIYTD